MPSPVTFPAPEHGWVLVSGLRTIAESEELPSLGERRSDVIVGIPAHYVSIFSVVLPPTGLELHESMIFAQVEKRGLAQTAEGAGMIDFRLIEKSAEGDSFLVSVVQHLGEDLIVPSASGYDLSASLRPVPQGGACLWREHGRLVLGLYADGEILHLQVLSSSTHVDAAAGSEVSLILMSLAGDPVLGSRLPSSIQVSTGSSSQDDREGFAKAVQIQVVEASGEMEASTKVSFRSRLLPADVTRARRRSATKKRLIIGLSVALVAYLVVASWLWVRSQRTADQIVSLEKQIAILEPDVTRIQQVEQRWNKLEPAFEKAWFPLVQLSQITSALPGSGVVIREFRTERQVIRIEGQAKDVQLANRLLEDLQGMTEFSDYEWDMPNPKVEKNNTATFRIEAKPKNEIPNK